MVVVGVRGSNAEVLASSSVLDPPGEKTVRRCLGSKIKGYNDFHGYHIDTSSWPSGAIGPRRLSGRQDLRTRRKQINEQRNHDVRQKRQDICSKYPGNLNTLYI